MTVVQAIVKETVVATEGKSFNGIIRKVLIEILCRNYDRRGGGEYRKQGTSNYDSDESDGGNSYSNEPNNKVIVRGLASHITEADVSAAQTL